MNCDNIIFFIISIVQLYYSRDAVDIKKFIFQATPFYIFGLLMYFIIKYINIVILLNTSVILKLILNAMVGIFVYIPISIIYLLKNKIIFYK